MLERNARKVIFDEVAEEYDAIRPGYPEEFIDEVLRLAGLPENGAVLEVGCGSGQATRPLADRAGTLLGIDISPALLKIAAQKFAGKAGVRFQRTSFEEFEAPAGSFDLVLAASSWHWVDPDIGYTKAATLLKPDGCLAVIATLHPKPFTGFFERVQEIYRQVVPEWGDPNRTRTTADAIRDAGKEMEESGRFRAVTNVAHRWSVEYGRDDYLRLLTTYSDHYRLGPERLGRLLERMGALIDKEYGGGITRPYETVAYVGRK